MNKISRLLFLIAGLIAATCLGGSPVSAANPDSFVLSAICDLWPPTRITDLVAQVEKDGQLKISWTAPEENKNKISPTNQPVSGYRIKYATFSVTEFNNDENVWWDTVNYQIEQNFAQQPGSKEELIANANLMPNTVYYFAVRSYDKVGNWSDLSNITTNLDTTPPQAIASVNDGLGTDINYTNSPQELSANWSAAIDLESSIARYWYAIGTTVGGVEVIGWNDNGLNTAVTCAGLTLIEGTTYYFSVKAENSVGLQSSPARSNGQIVDCTPPETKLDASGPLFNKENGDYFAPMENKYKLISRDGLAGVDVILIKINGQPWDKYRGEIVFDDQSEYQLKYKAVDLVGNWELEKDLKLIVDGTKPQLLSISPQDEFYLRVDELKEIKANFSEGVFSPENNWSKNFIIREFRTQKELSGAVSYDQTNFSLSFTPNEALRDNCEYEVIIKEGVVDQVGYSLTGAVSRFATMLRKEIGGKVAQENVTLEIPPEAIEEDAFIKIERNEANRDKKIIRPFWLWPGNGIYKIEGYNRNKQLISDRLNNLVNLSVGYGKIPLNPPFVKGERGGFLNDNTDKSSLKLFRYNEAEGYWQILTNSINSSTNEMVSATIEKLGEYSLAGFVAPNDSLDDLTNYPNPFAAGREETTIQYYLNENSEVNIAIYDLLGNLVKLFRFVAGEETGGRKGLNQVKWGGRNGRGDVVANGGYLCRIEVNGGKNKLRKILVIK